MKIQTTRFGEVDVPEENFLTFPLGLVGLPHYTRYVIFNEGEDGGYQWLQALDEPGLAFIIVPAELIQPDFQAHLPDETGCELELGKNDPGSVFVIVTIPKGKPEETTANLRGPIVVNYRTRKAKQLILHESIPLRFPLCGGTERTEVQLEECLEGSSRV